MDTERKQRAWKRYAVLVLGLVAGCGSPLPNIESLFSSPAITFTASPATLSSGGSSTLSWTVINANTVSIDHGIGTVNSAGQRTVSVTATTSYTLTAVNSAGTSTARATVTVSLLPVITFTASPATISSGGSSTLSWSVANATSVSIDQGIGVVDSIGRSGVNPAATTTYTLTAVNSSGTSTAHATVTVSTYHAGPTGWLYTKSNQNRIYVSDGNSGETIWMGRGVNMDDLFLCGYNNSLWMANPTAEQALVNIVSGLMADWKPNFVRMSLSLSSYQTVSWLNNPSQYHDPMVNVINEIGSYPGVYVLVTLRSDPTMSICNDNGDDAVCLPSAKTDAVYEALVDSFKDAPYVLFGLSNEPGGMSASDSVIRAAMSHAADVIRAREDYHGTPHHLIAVQGNSWTSRIGFYSTTPLSQDNIVYEYHSYPPEATGTYGYTYANIPVIIGEYGSLSDAAAFFTDMEAKQIPNLAWDFEPYSNCAPDLLQVNHSSTNLLPTTWGATVKAYLLAH
jgi:hypothetical protein